MEPYIVKDSDITEFWNLCGETLFMENFYSYLNDDILNYVNENVLENTFTMKNYVKVIKKNITFNDVYEFMDCLFWFRMYFFCKFSITLYDDTTNWYFNTPNHPFEVFLTLKLGDEYKNYATKYPNLN